MATQCVSSAKPGSDEAQDIMRDSHRTPSPHRTLSNKPSTKPKRPPTITPKRFKKFFTPSSSLQRGKRLEVSRFALAEIAGSATNKRRRRAQVKPLFASIRAKMESTALQPDDIPTMDNENAVISTEETLEQSDSLKRKRSSDEDPDSDHVDQHKRVAAELDDSEGVTDGIDGCEDLAVKLHDGEGLAIELDDGTDDMEHLETNTDVTENDAESEEDGEEDESTGEDSTAGESEGSTAKLSEMGREIRRGYQEWAQDRYEREKTPNPIVRSRYYGVNGAVSRRELGMATEPLRRPVQDYANSWQCETANFMSRPNGIHVCIDLTRQPAVTALPFCTSGFNQTSLVAVGDENGGIRFLDSEPKQDFSKMHLGFRPHNNAVLDLTLSPDDILLATAAGDQTCQIINVMTQQTTNTLCGHTSSVKQVRFQPGSSNNVLTTCSRDGSIKIWDLRCRGNNGPQAHLQTSTLADPDMKYPACINTLSNAHNDRTSNTPSTRASSRHNAASVTTISFLDTARPHLLLSGSDTDSCVKLWDIRGKMNNRRAFALPISTTLQPESHLESRAFGLVDMVLSGDGKRMYTLAKDSTVYAYATSHLVLGSAPDLEPVAETTKYKAPREELEGIGPLYGFRHPKVVVSTFYPKMSIRRARDNHSELLAVGSQEHCAVIFPTDERYMRSRSMKPVEPEDPDDPFFEKTYRMSSPVVSQPPPPTTSKDNIKIYNHGAALLHGHDLEVTCVCWTTDGELVTVSDDQRVRIWREDQDEATKLRVNTEDAAERDGHGWAEVHEDWDDYEETADNHEWVEEFERQERERLEMKRAQWADDEGNCCTEEEVSEDGEENDEVDEKTEVEVEQKSEAAEVEETTEVEGNNKADGAASDTGPNVVDGA